MPRLEENLKRVRSFNENYSIFFDLDDTLVNSSETILKRISILLNLYPVKEGAFYLFNLLSDPNREEILSKKYTFSKRLWQDYENLRREIKVKPIGNLQIKLNLLVSEGLNLGILTQNSYKSTISKLKQCDLFESFFSLGIHAKDNTKYGKPNPLFFKNFEGSKTLYIGDTLEDYIFTTKARINHYAVCTGFCDRAVFIKNGIRKNRIFDSIQEVELNEETFST
jgi:phosphoglycolate phosphatase-like HAD superfamily hydrolase